MTSWGPGGSGVGLWARSLVVYFFGGVGRVEPLPHSLYQLLPDPKGLVLKGKPLDSVIHSPHPLLGFSVLFTGDGAGKRFPQVLAPTE